MSRSIAPVLAGGMVAAAILLAGGISVGQEKEHLRVEHPAKLTPAVAQTIYENAAQELARGYASAEHVAAKRYLSWRRDNTAPYLSATHGNRYINNYSNEAAAAYARLAPGDRLPEGAIVAKDSFTVVGERTIFPAALFIMEKLAAGTSPETGDWRYVMVMPDGSLFGDSAGHSAEAVAYCHDCHAGVEETDFVFGIPKRYRR